MFINREGRLGGGESTQGGGGEKEEVGRDKGMRIRYSNIKTISISFMK